MIATLLVFTASAVGPEATPKLNLVRQFVEALIKEPATARPLVTPDALIVSGDMGFHMSDALNPAPTDQNPFEACALESLAENPEESAALFKNIGQAQRADKIIPSAFDGTMTCTASGKVHRSEFRVVLSGDKVALFQLTGGR